MRDKERDWPRGLAALDAKHLAKLESWDHPAVKAVRPTNNPPYGLARVRRAHLVSSSACVCLGQRPLPGETNESGACDFIRQLLAEYGRTGLIEAFLVDAGNASLEHANLIQSD
jgi:hypothetical protein